MKILEVVEACNAGVGRHVINLCSGLVEEGYEITVAYSSHRLDAAFRRFIDEYAGRIHFVVLDLRREVSLLPDIRAAANLVSFIKREGPFDLVHGHSSKGGALARIAGRLTGLPTVYTPNSLILSSPEISKAEHFFYGAIELTLGRLATAQIIAVSEEERDFILKLGLVPGDRLALIRNHLSESDFKRFSPSSSSKSLREKPLTFGAATRFSAQKAPGLAVEAFIRAAESLPQVPMQLMIAGSGELYEEVKEKAERGEWSDKILLPGWSDDPPSVLRELDVFVISSLYEGFSYSLLEAMAAGLPVVSTAVFGARESVGQIEGNAVVPPDDVNALAEGIGRMATLASPDFLRTELQRIGEINSRYVREHFSQSEAVRRTSELYRQVARKV